jgi:uncharacterized protein (TIGR03083 family)
LRQCLAADYARMREVAARDLTASVPSCPDWDVAELVRHTGAVYLHKAQAMRSGMPGEGEWPPPGINDEPPLALLDRGYAELVHEFDTRAPGDHAGTWYTPDQTVGFWIRRMAQETVIHRVDSELALSEAIAPIADDLATDGVDEVLEIFLSYITTQWASEIPDLADCDGRAVRVETGTRGWTLHLTPGGVNVDAATGHDASVSGEPDAVLLWLWRRAGDGAVSFGGDRALVKKLHDLMGASTQ